MKNNLFLYMALALVISCGKNTTKLLDTKAEVSLESLPFHKIELNDLSDFNPTSKNWQIVANAVVDRSKKRSISGTEGTGVLLNNSDKISKKHIFTNFEHGDIELELDVMMPVGSNSGIYFQGRYEIQLFDSWNVKNHKFSDIGGIYQRWDSSRKKGEEGYEGHAAKINAAKAPGLWQHFKIDFSAPKFNNKGDKIANAKFNEVWLNGVLIHENIQVTGPTRAAAFSTETAMAPIMIQGDHGPVAFKNIKYKLYKNQNISFTDLNFKEFDKTYTTAIPDLRMIKESKNENVKRPILSMLKNRSYTKTALFTGFLNVPETGDYLFNFNANNGGANLLLINNDTINSTILTLKKGENIPFYLAASKAKPWLSDFRLSVEGPGIKKQSIDPKIAAEKKPLKRNPKHTLYAHEKPNVQRSFMHHKGDKRMHCISVGTPEGIHYAFDLEYGSVLSTWSGNIFFDATQMWSSRGSEQFGRTGSFATTLYGANEFAILKDPNENWPVNTENIQFDSYKFATNGLPFFTHKIQGAIVINKFFPNETNRGLTRKISIDSPQEMYYKIDEGASIQKATEGTYIINNESYFVSFSKENNLAPFIRKSKNKEELLIKIPAGKQQISYTIIW